MHVGEISIHQSLQVSSFFASSHDTGPIFSSMVTLPQVSQVCQLPVLESQVAAYQVVSLKFLT